MALTHSDCCEACSAAISHSVLMAAAEWRTGMDTRANTAEMICASRNVQVPDINVSLGVIFVNLERGHSPEAARGKRKPEVIRLALVHGWFNLGHTNP